MFKYLLLKVIFDVPDVDVVERSKYDMSFKYFLDMAPEDDVINPSSLTKFRKLRLKDLNLLDILISKTVQVALEKGIIKSKSIDTDAKVGHKTADTSFFGYKTHIAMTEERIITAAVVTSGEKADGKELVPLVEKSKEAGIEVENVIGDTDIQKKGTLNMRKKKK